MCYDLHVFYVMYGYDVYVPISGGVSVGAMVIDEFSIVTWE